MNPEPLRLPPASALRNVDFANRVQQCIYIYIYMAGGIRWYYLRTVFGEYRHDGVDEIFENHFQHVHETDGQIFGQRVRAVGDHLVEQALRGPRQRERQHDSGHQVRCT